MRLPFRIRREAGPEPVVSLDGAFGARGLNLSHWPGNTTPAALRHDLSTGSALAFARLSEREQAALVGDAREIVNNHYDTDGVCSLFAVLRPREALEREHALLDVAAAGDFYWLPSRAAVRIDVLVGAMADAERSPWRADFAGQSEERRHEIAALRAVELLPSWLDGDLEPWREHWGEFDARLALDLEDLTRAQRDDVVHLDWSVWTAHSVGRDFAPGRHALFGTGQRDRVLTLDSRADGTRARFLLSTRSWFDLVSPAPPPRPDLEALARRLNELEGSAPDADLAWHTQSTASPSPELWFGRAELDSFAEHNEALAPSRLAPQAIKREIAQALRDALALPE